VNIRPDKGIKDFVLGPNAKPSDTKIGNRPAKVVENPLTLQSCTVALQVTETSRVDAAASGVSTAASCDAAQKLAAVIEPNLP
jgi:hypothetical protein